MENIFAQLSIECKFQGSSFPFSKEKAHGIVEIHLLEFVLALSPDIRLDSWSKMNHYFGQDVAWVSDEGMSGFVIRGRANWL